MLLAVTVSNGTLPLSWAVVCAPFKAVRASSLTVLLSTVPTGAAASGTMADSIRRPTVMPPERVQIPVPAHRYPYYYLVFLSISGLFFLSLVSLIAMVLFDSEIDNFNLLSHRNSALH